MRNFTIQGLMWIEEDEWMDRGGEKDNEHRQMIYLIRNTQTQDVFIREL